MHRVTVALRVQCAWSMRVERALMHGLDPAGALVERESAVQSVLIEMDRFLCSTG